MVRALCSLLLQQRLHTHKPAHTPCIPPHFPVVSSSLMLGLSPRQGGQQWEHRHGQGSSECHTCLEPCLHQPRPKLSALPSGSHLLSFEFRSVSHAHAAVSALAARGHAEGVNHLPSRALTIHHRLPWSNAASFPSASCFLALTSSLTALLLPPCRSLGSTGRGGMGKEAGAAAEVASGMLGAASATLTPPASNLTAATHPEAKCSTLPFPSACPYIMFCLSCILMHPPLLLLQEDTPRESTTSPGK
ncbi:unnamed protein product [Closterium sp. Naga37s-1]|nr:unnamed protein product [Closterium sp. Naga37s-1]